MRVRYSFLVATTAVAALAMLRCGSDDTSGIAPSGDAGPDGLASSSSSSGTASSSSSSSSSSSGGNGDTDGGSDAGADAFGGITDDAGPGGTTTELTCGSTSCAIPGQVCCIERLGTGGASYLCASGSTCPPVDAGPGPHDPPTALGCSGAANCTGGTICCVEQVGSTVSSSCKATCTGPNTAQLCDPKAAVSGCPADAGALSTCSSQDIVDWGLPETFGTCGGRGN